MVLRRAEDQERDPVAVNRVRPTERRALVRVPAAVADDDHPRHGERRVDLRVGLREVPREDSALVAALRERGCSSWCRLLRFRARGGGCAGTRERRRQPADCCNGGPRHGVAVDRRVRTRRGLPQRAAVGSRSLNEPKTLGAQLEELLPLLGGRPRLLHRCRRRVAQRASIGGGQPGECVVGDHDRLGLCEEHEVRRQVRSRRGVAVGEDRVRLALDAVEPVVGERLQRLLRVEVRQRDRAQSPEVEDARRRRHHPDPRACERGRRRQRPAAERAAELLRHECQPNEPEARQRAQHACADRAGDRLLEQPVVRDQERRLEPAKRVQPVPLPGPRRDVGE